MASASRRQPTFEKLNSRRLLAADLVGLAAPADLPGVDSGVDAGVDTVQVAAGEGQPTAYLKYKLDRCFVKSWSISGDADDRPTDATTTASQSMAWDNTKQLKWQDSGVSVDPAAIDEAMADDTPTEEVAFYYNKIAFAYAKTTPDK